MIAGAEHALPDGVRVFYLRGRVTCPLAGVGSRAADESNRLVVDDPATEVTIERGTITLRDVRDCATKTVIADLVWLAEGPEPFTIHIEVFKTGRTWSIDLHTHEPVPLTDRKHARYEPWAIVAVDRRNHEVLVDRDRLARAVEHVPFTRRLSGALTTTRDHLGTKAASTVAVVSRGSTAAASMGASSGASSMGASSGASSMGASSLGTSGLRGSEAARVVFDRSIGIGAFGRGMFLIRARLSRLDAAGSPRTDAAGSPRTDAAGSPRTGAAGSPRTDAAGSPRTDAAGSPRTDAAGSPRTDATGSPRVDAAGSPRTDAAGSPRTDAAGSPRTDAAGSPRTDAAGSPRVDAAGSPRTDAAGSPRTDAAGSPRVDAAGSPRLDAHPSKASLATMLSHGAWELSFEALTDRWLPELVARDLVLFGLADVPLLAPLRAGKLRRGQTFAFRTTGEVRLDNATAPLPGGLEIAREYLEFHMLGGIIAAAFR